MAEEDNSQKTEDPTARRLEKAFEEGNVPKSQEVASWCLLAAGTAIVGIGAGPMITQLRDAMRAFIERPQTIDLGAQAGGRLLSQVGLVMLGVLALPFLALIVGALAGHLLQHRPTWSTNPLEPKLDKLSPMKGLSRLFGPQGWINLLKALFKLALITAAASMVLWPERDRFLSFVTLPVEYILPNSHTLVLKVLTAILIALAAVAAGDLFYQRFSYRQRMRMTKQEVKDEHKDIEGDPKIKAKIRQVRQERMRRRMMAAIPTATVVVANPTHYAVALRYVEKETPAPVCVAKGVDELALRIRFAAKEHNVPIVENPPLARALHATVEIDDMVPPEHYKAVAEVIGFVFKLKNRGKTAPRRRQAAR